MYIDRFDRACVCGSIFVKYLIKFCFSFSMVQIGDLRTDLELHQALAYELLCNLKSRIYLPKFSCMTALIRVVTQTISNLQALMLSINDRNDRPADVTENLKRLIEKCMRELRGSVSEWLHTKLPVFLCFEGTGFCSPEELGVSIPLLISLHVISDKCYNLCTASGTHFITI